MIKQFLYLSFLFISFSIQAQHVPGGHPRPGPKIGIEQFKMVNHVILEKRLIKAFKAAWIKCGKGEVPFKNIKELDYALLVDKIGSIYVPQVATCAPDCIFTEDVKKALGKFNGSSWMTQYLIYQYDMGEAEAKAIVDNFKTYE